jgi:cbb3-type cytochrome oxidase subunit 3
MIPIHYVQSFNIPLYILLLFALVFIALIYIVFDWIGKRYINDYAENIMLRFSNNIFSSNRRIEGFSNPQYTYKPSSNSPNLSITFGLSDLAIDLSSVCGFICDSNKSQVSKTYYCFC